MPIYRVTDRVRNVITQGEGLRPVLRFARKYPVEIIRVDVSVEQPEMYAVTFYFDPEGRRGYECMVRFADWRVLLDWLLARRSWTALHRIRFAHRGTYELALQDKRTARLVAKGITIAGPAI
jgi:hypothetical protein